MKNIHINQQNEFDERSKAFFESKQAERLAQKYREKSYEERFRPVYYIALVVSYLCNGISIVTASSFVFAYVYSILNALPYPIAISFVFTGFVLVTIEVLQRILAPRFFQSWLQYSKKSLSIALLVLSALSVTLSYMGSPDFISLISNEPVYQEPTLSNIAETKNDYKEQITQAKEEAEEYKNRKLWHSRLSDKHAAVYKGMLANVSTLREKMNNKVDESEKTNRDLLQQAKQDFEQEKQGYNNRIESKGAGLGIVAVLAQLFFYLSIWYIEYYDFRVATQYALQTRRRKQLAELEAVKENGVKKN